MTVLDNCMEANSELAVGHVAATGFHVNSTLQTVTNLKMAAKRSSIETSSSAAVTAALEVVSSLSAAAQAAAAATGPGVADSPSADGDHAAENADTKRVKRIPEFNLAHERRYGLQVAKRDDVTGSVTAVLCLFCKAFGREEKEGRKRRATVNLKYFKTSFRTDQYVQHLMSQHPQMWTKYRLVSDDEKSAFFQVVTKDELPTLSPSRSVAASTASPAATPSPAPSRRPVERRRASVETKPRLVPVKSSTPLPPAPVSAPAAVEMAQPAPVVVVETVAPAPTLTKRRPSDDEHMREIDVKQSIVDFVLAGSTSSVSADVRWQLRTFRSSELVHAHAAKDSIRTVYRVALHSRVQLELAVDFLAAGLTHPQLAKALTAVVLHTELDPAVAAADADALELVRLTSAMSLDAIAQLLEQSWAFTVAVHSAAHASCVDIQLRVYSHAAVHSLHLVALPLGPHDADVEAQYELFARTMNAVFPPWHQRLIGVATDRDAKHSASVAALSARIEREAAQPVYRSYCSRTQLDATMQQFYRALLSGAFLASFRALRAYIQRYDSLVLEMGQPPSVASSHPWLAMGKDTEWISDKRVRVRKHLDDAATSSSSAMPDDAWWIAFFVVHWVASRANDAFKALENKRLSAAQQTDVLADLLADVVQAFNVKAPAASSSGDDTNAAKAAPQRHTVSSTSIRDFLGDLGMFVNNVVARTAPAALDAAVASIATSLVDLVEALAAMTADKERASSDDHEPDAPPSADALPPVLPHELAQLSGREFAALLARHDAPLRACFSDEELDGIDQEHQALRRASAKDKTLQAALSQCTDETPFEHAWSLTAGRFRALERFAGGLATVFATPTAVISSSVSTDVSAAAVCALDSRMDGALEATLHAQQWHHLQRLVQQPLQRATKRKFAEL